MKPPRTPVRPPPPPPVPMDHIVDANKMVETPRPDAVMDHRVKLWDAINRYVSSCGGNPSRNVYGNTRRQQCVSEIESLVYSGLERELAAANDKMSEQAKLLLDTVNDRNRLGTQLDLVRDELQRIWARVMESCHADHPSLSWIKVYCERAQKDIAVNYTPIQERDKLSRELAAANAEVARLKSGGCARDQRATQWCAEAVALARKLEEANTRIAVLEQWIRSLEDIEFNPSEHRRWCGDPIGWLNPGHAVFVGKDKPKGLR